MNFAAAVMKEDKWWGSCLLKCKKFHGTFFSIGLTACAQSCMQAIVSLIVGCAYLGWGLCGCGIASRCLSVIKHSIYMQSKMNSVLFSLWVRPSVARSWLVEKNITSINLMETLIQDINHGFLYTHSGSASDRNMPGAWWDRQWLAP